MQNETWKTTIYQILFQVEELVYNLGIPQVQIVQLPSTRKN